MPHGDLQQAQALSHPDSGENQLLSYSHRKTATAWGAAVRDQEETQQVSLEGTTFLFPFFFDFIYLYWSIVDLKYHVSFCCIAK